MNVSTSSNRRCAFDNKQYDIAVYIGRFQPFHQGHLACVKRGLTVADRVVVVIGSTNQPRSIRNPFSAYEREVMIRDSLTPAESDRIDIVGVEDDPDDQQWKNNVRGKVLNIARRSTPGRRRIAILGYQRDESSYYLEMFPEWCFVALPEYQDITATTVRHQYFLTGDIRSVTRPVAHKLRKFRRSAIYRAIANTLCEQLPDCECASGSLRN